ncbi:MAG TPA: patatin-like phospholipase family protein [Bryobacteraceae bacterium]|nr:patatin-like phospholipase family protein [Bryobacteraceae bacterium]
MDRNWVRKAASRVGGLLGELRRSSHPSDSRASSAPPPAPRIGLALGGGFARGIAHAGVLKVLENNHIPIHCVTGVSAGAIVAAAYASGATPAEIATAGCAMRFADVGRWQLGRLGLVGSERMHRFLQRLLKAYQFEEMRIPLGVLATDLSTGEPVPFFGSGKVFDPIRASCSYPGLFQPVRLKDRLLVDGAMSMEIPAALARQLGATHVISVHLPMRGPSAPPHNMFQVVNRCFQIMQCRSEEAWRNETDALIAPDVRGVDWDGFARGPQLIAAGEAAALAMLPTIQSWFSGKEAANGSLEFLPQSMPQEV